MARFSIVPARSRRVPRFDSFWLYVSVTLFLVVGACPFTVAGAGEGLQWSSTALHPGKLDLHVHTDAAGEDYNVLWWSPMFKGGAGILLPVSGAQTYYGGGCLRPLVGYPTSGDLVLAAQSVRSPGTSAFEAQGEYRTPWGWGIGAGTMQRSQEYADVAFGKILYRHGWSQWNYILEAQRQRVGHRWWSGGYAGLYSPHWLAVGGSDGEQWRVCGGYVGSRMQSAFNPAFEVLYIDETIGQTHGNMTFMGNACLRFRGGFLSHAARLGRALGPTGLEIGNPLGFAAPTWNRRPELWEMGGGADLRIVRTRLPNGRLLAEYTAVAFPFQLAPGTHALAPLFLGGGHVERRDVDSAVVLAGFFGKLGFATLAAGSEFVVATHSVSTYLGFFDQF